MTDAELLVAVAEDPETGMRAVVDGYGAQLMGRLRRYAIDREFGDVDVDDVYVAALKRLLVPELRDEVRRRGGQLLPWLSRWGYWRLSDRDRERRRVSKRLSSETRSWREAAATPSAASGVSDVLCEGWSC